MNEMNEKLRIGLWVLGILIVMIIFLRVWIREFKELMKVTPLFFYVYLLLFMIFLSIGIWATFAAEDPNKDWLRYIFVGAGVVAMIWNGTWCAQRRSDKSDNIQSRNF